jgi:WD40 repeat protein
MCFSGHSGEVNSAAVSSDEKIILSGATDCTVRLWKLETGLCVKILHGHCEVVWRVAIAHDCRLAASGSGDNTVRLWDLQEGEALDELVHPDRVAAIAFAPDGRLVVGCDDTRLYIYRTCIPE